METYEDHAYSGKLLTWGLLSLVSFQNRLVNIFHLRISMFTLQVVSLMQTSYYTLEQKNPSNLETPPNRTFSLVPKVSGLEGFHCIWYYGQKLRFDGLLHLTDRVSSQYRNPLPLDVACALRVKLS